MKPVGRDFGVNSVIEVGQTSVPSTIHVVKPEASTPALDADGVGPPDVVYPGMKRDTVSASVGMSN